MEVLFCILYYFFTDPPQKSQRRDGQAKENAGKISHPVAQKEKQGTEQQEVADGAAQHSGHHIEAQDPAAPVSRAWRKSPRVTRSQKRRSSRLPSQRHRHRQRRMRKQSYTIPVPRPRTRAERSAVS